MELQLVAAFEHAFDLSCKRSIGIEPRHFVLVLVGHQLEVIPCDGLGEREFSFARADLLRFRHAHSFNQFSVSLRVGAILVGGEELDAARDQLLEVARERLRDGNDLGRGREALHARKVGCGAPPPQEGLPVEFDGNPVQLDRAQERIFCKRHPAFLKRVAEHEHVGGDRIAHESGREFSGRDEFDVFRARGIDDVRLQVGSAKLPVGVLDEIGGRRDGRVDEHLAALVIHLRKSLRARGHHEIAAEHEVGGAGADAHRVELRGRGRDPHVGHHRAEFLSEAAHVEHGGTLAFEVRSHRHYLADGDHAHAADSRHEDAERAIESAPRRRDRKFSFPFRQRRLALFQGAAFDRDEARAESLQAGIVLVAGGLVDGALATELGLERFDREAIRLDAAIAAAFTDHLVDDHAPGGIGELLALSASALLGGAGLHVDDRRNAFFLAQLALHSVEVLARPDRRSGGPGQSRQHRFLLVHDRDDRAHALRGDLARDHRRVERTVEGLAAGHRHRVVVQDLVGHAHAGRHRGADGKQS